MWKVKINGITIFAIILALYLAIGGSASAATISVGDDGSADYATIQAAVNNSSSGDEIIVKPGTYTETIEVTVNDLTIVSESGSADTIIQAVSGANVFNVWASEVNIKGFTMKGVGDSRGVSLDRGASSCNIQNNKFSDFLSGVDINIHNGDNVISNNEVSNCSEGLAVAEDGINKLTNNIITNCNYGIVCYQLAGYNTISNNTISKCNTGIWLIESYKNVIESNFVIENGVGISSYFSPADQIYNNYFSNTVNVDFEEGQASHTWNTTRTTGKNIIDGLYIGGNYWATPSDDGFSQTHSDANEDGFADVPYELNEVNIDYLPLVVPAEKPVLAPPVANFKADTTKNAPLSVLFTDLSQNTTSRSWDINNDGIEDSNEASFVYTYNSTGTYTVNLTVSNANGTVSKTETIAVEKDSSGGSSIVGGGGGSPEPARNVETRELSQVLITNGKAVQFDFAKNATCVVYVSFDAKKTVGKTTTIVEELKNKSALVSELPAGEVYKSFNVWVGNSGFVTSNNIENPAICFKVEKAWGLDKKVDKNSIVLNRYSDEKWEQLPATLSEEDDKFLYFIAEVPAFSSFVITGKVKGLSEEGAINSEPEKETRILEEDMKSTGEEVGRSSAQEEDTKAPGFEMVYGIISLCAIFLYNRK